MKKSNILIVMLAVIAVASVAGAVEVVDFDGKFKPQSMHDLFAAGHQLLPAAALDTKPALPNSNSSISGEKTYRSISYKVQQAQLAALADINSRVIRDARLERLLRAPGTEAWFSGARTLVINADLKSGFAINDAGITTAVASAGFSGQKAAVVDDAIFAGIVAEGAKVIWNSITEYASWPPVPDSGMANYDPVTGNDFSPGWGRRK